MQRRNLAPSDRADRHLAQCRQNVAVEVAAVDGGRARLAVHLHVQAHEALGEVGHGQLRLGRRRYRVLTALYAVDDDGYLLPPLFGEDVAVATEGHSPEPHRASGLHHVDFAPGGVHPNPEAGQVPVPEQRVLGADGEGIDGALGKSQL